MNDPILVLDSHYLCHRAFHSQGHLSFKGDATGVIFGFLKSISIFKQEFNTDRVVFCFEGANLKRKKIYPQYKDGRGRRMKTPAEQKAYTQLAIQIQALRQRYLSMIGFKNIFCFDGYESDDVMAAIAAEYSKESKVILVTADSDMYQCLANNVTIYHPQKQVEFDETWFRTIYKIKPSQWAVVKAIAGCHSDNVKGVGGVGEATALKFLWGMLSRTSAAHHKIMGLAGKHIVRTNRRLVKLPYDDCPLPTLRDDKISAEGWKECCALLGMKTMIGSPPVLGRQIGKQYARKSKSI